MSFSAVPSTAPLAYLGTDAPNPRNTFYRRRAPTNSDRRLYKVGDRWIDTASQIAYILVGKTATSANWVQMSGAGGVTSLNGLMGVLTIVNQGGAGAVAVTVPGSGGPNSIGLSVNVDGVTMQIVGNQLVSNAAAIFNVDAFTVPGTNPVLTTGGMITINGSQVAAGSFATGIQTHSVAANQFDIQVQRSSAQALSTVGANGISHFDSSMFSVDANGFVSLLGGSVALDSVAVQAGISPVVPDGAGLMTISAGAVAPLGVPAQTRGTGANAFSVEIQRASSSALTDATSQGLASFDSSMFLVDANGFVQLAGGGIAIDTITVNTFTGPGTNPVLPDGAGNVTVLGTAVPQVGIPLQTNSIAANSYEVQVQRAAATALTDATSQGVASFNSAQFTVDANGFVSSLTATFTWQDLAPGALTIFNGYFATGAGAYTLPAGVVDGETIEIVDQIGGGVVVTAAGGQFIQISNVLSSAGGTATSTQTGDALRLIYRATNTTWICVPGAAGIWNLA